jgi:hypothetical protein
MYKMHHSKIDIFRLYLKKKGGERGLLQTVVTYKGETINIAEYLKTKYAEDQFVNIIKSNKSHQPSMKSTMKMAAKFAQKLNQSHENSDTKKEGMQQIKAKLGKYLKIKWESKVMHGQYIRSMDRQLVCGADMFLWLLRGDLEGRTESEKIGAQDQALQTTYHATRILQRETDSKCRLCKQFDKTVDHIISACPLLAKERHIKRQHKET